MRWNLQNNGNRTKVVIERFITTNIEWTHNANGAIVLVRVVENIQATKHKIVNADFDLTSPLPLFNEELNILLKKLKTLFTINIRWIFHVLVSEKNFSCLSAANQI